MKKHLLLVLIIILSMFGLMACGGDDAIKEVTISPDELCARLSEETVTTDPLAALPSNDLIVATYFVDMEKIEDSAAYLNTGITGCEIAAIKCSDESYASEVAELFKNRVKKQHELYSTYDTVAAAKIDKALIKTSGNYVVLCIADDYDKAEEILKEVGF